LAKPATTYFCKNGHQVEHNPPNMYGELDELREMEDLNMAFLFDDETPEEEVWPNCKVCGARIIKRPALDWTNTEESTSPIVKTGATKYEDIVNGAIMQRSIAVYDVSSLRY
jgi:hypothetical protein